MAEVESNKNVYAIGTNVTSSLGLNVDAHWQALSKGEIGIQQYSNTDFSSTSFYGSRLNGGQWGAIANRVDGKELSSFEQLALYSAQSAIGNLSNTIDLDDTILVLSTTKGNVALLEDVADEHTLLHSSAEKIACQLGITAKPIVVSHACVSGSVALLYAQRMLSAGRYKNAIVIGCDCFTPFVLNGFQSFQAIADGPCRPFDADRTGINLGEAAATIILSTEQSNTSYAMLSGGATSNDANHISGPSRTGEELADAIQRALEDAGLSNNQIDMVSAHGTATAYNDEMEAKALNLSGLSDIPVHSMKSYTGHTLGAAGVLESAIVIKAIRHQQLVPSTSYEKHGVSVPLNVTTKMQPATVNHVLKTASGFGGSNAAIIWSKV